MKMNEEDAKKPVSYQIGQSLDDLSVDELNELIGTLKNEIGRIEMSAASKSAHLSAADALFKK